ncbi:MAG TPA: DNA polymerase III subunit gamma/tau [Gemmataceae bacterium]|nr:DNA polymerase III subunit gamma/tau [Gemmataceae bacterium]
MAKSKPATPPAAPEGYTVLARRYRPQGFAELVGQEAVARALVNALKSNRVAHAYLFTGARGVGKTSTARILAKALNCVKGPTPEPCNECVNCKLIAAGEDVDVIEIDGASNNKVDEVRELRSNVQYAPSRSRFKIYIIDEVHMLTTSAFNALLKTLEEPPPHVKFIFATTEVQKIPITILSRCQRFDFASIGTPRIVERLRQVVAAEGMKADDEALELVARRAGGSMRDAQSLLDQLLAFGADRLTVEQVHALLGTAGDDRVLALAAAVLAHEPAKALELFGQGIDEGAQLGELLDQLIAYWRDLMVLHCAGEAARDLSVAPRHRDTLAKQAAALKLDTILAGLDVLNTTKFRLRGSNHGRVLMEMALVRLGRLDDLVSLGQVAQWLAQPGSAPAPAARPAPAALPEGVKKKPLTAAVEAPPEAAAPSALPLSEETLPRVWQDVLAQAGPLMARQLEKSHPPAIFRPNTLVLRFDSRYNSEREHCSEPSRVQRIEESLRKVTGHAWQLRIESVGSGAVAAQNEAADATTPPPRSRLKRAEAAQEPLLKRAADVLGAQVVHMDDDFGTAAAQET